MTDIQQCVLDRHPTARCVFDRDKGTHKVYYWINGCQTALSGSWESAGMAWMDALDQIQKREAQHAQ